MGITFTLFVPFGVAVCSKINALFKTA